MRRLLDKIQAALSAVAFAEEGEVDTARRIMAEAGMDGAGGRQGDRAVSPPRVSRASRTNRPRSVERVRKI